MKNYHLNKLLVVTICCLNTISCSLLSQPHQNNKNLSNIPTTAQPAYNLDNNESNTANQPNNKRNSSATSLSSNNTKPRIEEDRNAGEIEQIKVNNRNLPSYYIYPTQQQNWNTNRTPDQNVSTTNWQISW